MIGLLLKRLLGSAMMHQSVIRARGLVLSNRLGLLTAFSCPSDASEPSS